MARYQSFRKTAISDIPKNAPEVVTIIFDLWTEPSGLKRSFLNIQLQFSVGFEIKNINLRTAEFEIEKSGENLEVEILSILREFNVSSKYIFKVSDQGTNV